MGRVLNAIKYLALIIPVLFITVLFSDNTVLADENIASGSYVTYLASDRSQESSVTWVIDSEGNLTITGSGDSLAVCENEIIDEYGKVYRPDWPWSDYKDSITSATLKLSDFSCASYMFYQCSNMKSVDLSEIDTSQTISTYYMFAYCKKLIFIDVSGFDTSKIQMFNYMFYNCSSLRKLDLSGFDFSGILQNPYYKRLINNEKTAYPINYLINQCYSLRELDLSFDLAFKNSASEGESIDMNMGLTELDSLKNVHTILNCKDMMHLQKTNDGDYIYLWYDENGKPVTDTDNSYICLPVNDPVSHIYYRFEANIDYEHKLYFKLNGGYFTETSMDVIISEDGMSGTGFVYDDEPIGELPLPSRDGYIFEGWFTEKEGGAPVDTISPYTAGTDLTVYAHWTSKIVKVTFDARGGVSLEKERIVEIGKCYGVLPVPEKYDTEFKGWYLDEDFTKEINASSVVELNNDHTLYANWKEEDDIVIPEEHIYTVSFNAMGGAVSVKEKKVKTGEAYGELPVPVKEDYFFTGWYTKEKGGDPVTADSIFQDKHDRMLYAHYESIHVMVKQKYDVSSYFSDITGIKKYKAQSLDGGKVSIKKNGILTSKKPGRVVITPYIKVDKKLVPCDKSITVFVDKISVPKSIVLNNENPEIVLNDLLNISSEYKTDYSVISMDNNCISVIDFETGYIKAVNSGKTKLLLTVANSQGQKIKYKIKVCVKLA